MFFIVFDYNEAKHGNCIYASKGSGSYKSLHPAYVDLELRIYIKLQENGLL